ncbi:transposase [Candidatus Poribacteria bacterium]|nr:transposase [Candidatus Poribacteria bacterium]
MIEQNFDEALPPDWVKANIDDVYNELVILRQVIPWQLILDQLVSFYHPGKGRIGNSLRVMVGLLIISRMRKLSDREVVGQVKENRYLQYFCNVAESELSNFIHPTALCGFRKRLGEKGIAQIEESVFSHLSSAGVIEGDTLLMDSTVLANNLIYPTDVRLVYQAFSKMKTFAQRYQLAVWWDSAHLKKRWRAFGRSKAPQRATYLAEFYFAALRPLLFAPALQTLRDNFAVLKISPEESQLLATLEILETQTQQKLAGKRHIANRLVSLEEIDARPIKKGKTYPTCEFGSTVQMTFNRQGFMITTENFIGQPGDATLYGNTLKCFQTRMDITPQSVITDLGFRSQDNFSNTPNSIEHVFLGRSDDVIESRQDFCRRARSATEGFIAVSKNLRGFGKSLYNGRGAAKRLTGDRIWTLLCQTAYNLKKLVQLTKAGNLSCENLLKLGISMSNQEQQTKGSSRLRWDSTT